MAVKEFFDNLNGGARWDVGVSINRSNSLPLDANSVFASLADAQNYAAGTPVEGTLANAYPGQVLAVVTDAETIIYYIDANMTLQPVGNTKEVMAYIGDIPETSDALTIIEYINSKTEGIATTDSLAQLQKDVQALAVTLNGKSASEDEAAVVGLVQEVDNLKTAIGVEASEGVEATGIQKKIADEIAARESGDKAIADSIGVVAEGKTVVQMIEDAQAAATYDDTTVKAGIKANLDAIAVITEDYLKSADKTELSDKITEVENKIPTKVSALENDSNYLTAIPEEYVTDDELTAKGYQTASDVQVIVDTAIAEINHAVFQKVDAVPAASDAVANVLYLVPNGDKMDIYAKINEEMVLIDDTDADLSGYAKLDDLHSHANKELLDTYDQANADIKDAVEKKHSHSFADEDVNSVIAKQHEHANKEVLDTYTQSEEDLADAVAKKHAHENAAILDAITAEKVVAWDEAEKNVIASVDEAQFAVDADRKLTLLDIAMSKVTGLTDALASKAENGTTLAEYGITDAYTKAETEGRIQEVLDGLSDTSETAASVAQALETYKTANDARVLAVEGEVDGLQSVVGNAESGLVKDLADLTSVVSGHTEDIADLVAKDDEFTEAIKAINEKLVGIAAGAQVNVIEGIIFNGETVTVGENKIAEITYNLPIADADTIGGVKSATGENKISVAEDGTMEVNSVNVNKLVQTDGEFLIMNGGSASA